MAVRDGDYQARIIEDAPTFYWRLDNEYTDAMGNAAVGVPVSGVFGAPKFGVASASLNGTDGYINIPHNASMNFSTTQDFSVEVWLKKTAGVLGGYIVDHRSVGSTGFYILHTAADVINLSLGNSAAIVGPTIPEDGNYHHLVSAVDRDTNVTFYLDTVPTVSATVTTTRTADSTSQLTIGCRSFTQPSSVYVGLIDEVAIYRKLLTQADVNRHYFAGVKHYNGNVALIDNVGFDIDIAEQMFGLSNAPVTIKSVRFYSPTAADAIVLKDRSGNVVVELLCTTTNKDVGIEFDSDVLRCQGLKLVAADNTLTTGKVLITFA